MPPPFAIVLASSRHPRLRLPAKPGVFAGRSADELAPAGRYLRRQEFLDPRTPFLPESASPRFCRKDNPRSLAFSRRRAKSFVQTDDHRRNSFARAKLFSEFLRRFFPGNFPNVHAIEGPAVRIVTLDENGRVRWAQSLA